MINLEVAIRDLVGAYEGFWTAKMQPVERRIVSDWETVKQWADALKSSQQYLGIVVVEYDVIDANIAEADVALSKLRP